MPHLLFIFVGAGLGGVLRYLLSLSVHTLVGRGFPYGTLSVNVLGCFLMGFLYIVLMDRAGLYAAPLRSFLLVGFLGGFTTFSSFSLETLLLLENGEGLRALLNVLLSMGLCLAATGLGIIGGRGL